MQKVSKNHWGSKEAQREFFDKLLRKLDIKDEKGLKIISKKVINDNGGRGLLHRSNNSPYQAFQTLYPGVFTQ